MVVLRASLLSATLMAVPFGLSSAQARAGADRRACFSATFAGDVRSAIAGYANVARIPGVSVGVVFQDSLVYSTGVGFANKARQVRATPDTPYRVASLTKLFTATLVLQLAAEGRLDLDAPVSVYLPDSVRVPVDSGGRAITVRHLLTHSAGLPKNPPNRRNQAPAGPIDPGIWEAYNTADLYQALRTTHLEGAVGTHMVYSNYGYALLGHIAERVAGQRYEALLRSRLLTPLGMTSSGIVLDAKLDQARAADYWDEDDSRTEQLAHAHFGEIAGFIGLTSTVRDLAQFARLQLKSSSFRTVLSEAVVQQLSSPQLFVETDAGVRYDMAFGWFRRTPANSATTSPLLWHTGEVDGSTSGLYLLPERRLGVIVLQNLGGDSGSRGVEQIAVWLLRVADREAARCAR